MRVSFEWLQEYVKIDIPVEELAERLTMAGIAVEEIEDQAAIYRGIIIARVVSLEKHPQADNLFIARVDAGSYGKKQVITAAQNLKNGDPVPLALPGTTLPNGKTITEVDFKGVISQGMLCSGIELGLEKEATGIRVFEGEVKPGQPVAQVLGETDRVLVLELTANRADCLGMIGVAREVAAILETEFHPGSTVLQEEGRDIKGVAEVKIQDPDLCPRYAARVATGVKIEPSPEWMQRRLKAAGVRPINNIVDITNYVMLEYNQPLHAFDFDRIADRKIIIRRAKNGEKLVTLDEVERTFMAEHLLIADPSGGLCVAGVMGGCTSEVTEKTVNLFLEAAYFNPISIRKTAKLLNMKTEASLRFERGIDPNGVVQALNRAAYFIEKLGAGKVLKGYIDEYPQPVAPVTVQTTSQKINAWLGTDLATPKIVKILNRLTLEVKENQETIEVTVPTYRRDITHMADLAEEVARLYGYNQIPATIPASSQIGERSPFQKFEQDCRKLLQGVGLSEIMTYSLYAKNTAARLGLDSSDPYNKTVALMVPLSEEQAVMRTNMVNSILETLAFNSKRRQTDLAVYEIARVYLPEEGEILPREPLHLAIGLMGRVQDAGWNQSQAEVDFYDLKGIMELIFTGFRLPAYTLKASAKPFLHPGQAADIYINDQTVGFLGQVHPKVIREFEISKKALVMELDLTVLNRLRSVDTIKFEPLPKFPAVPRDLALVAPVEIAAQSIMERIKEISGELVERVDLFDVYQGDQVPKGMRSLAFSLSYRSKERTLNDNEVNQVQEQLLQKLRLEYGATIRSV
jgi:phenylalanyl-tRNA synthetase beta chain